MPRGAVAIVLTVAAAASAQELRNPKVEITDVGSISCVTTDLPGSVKQIRCTGHVSARTIAFPEGTHFDRSTAALTAYAGAYDDLGIGLLGEGAGAGGNSGVDVTVTVEGTVEDLSQCIGGSVPGSVDIQLYRMLGDGSEEQYSDSMETNVTVECS